MSYLSEWLERKGINPEEARKASGVDRQVWEILIEGGRTVPGLALTVGHNLGMKPREVRHLGVTPDADLRKEWRLFYIANPWHLDSEWWKRVGTFNAKAEALLVYGEPKKPPEQRELQKNSVVKKPHITRKDYWGETACRFCGLTFKKKAREQVYCSKRCATKDRERLG